MLQSCFKAICIRLGSCVILFEVGNDGDHRGMLVVTSINSLLNAHLQLGKGILDERVEEVGEAGVGEVAGLVNDAILSLDLGSHKIHQVPTRYLRWWRYEQRTDIYGTEN